MRRMSFEDKPPSRSAGNGGWGGEAGMDGWMDKKIQKKKREEGGLREE